MTPANLSPPSIEGAVYLLRLAASKRSAATRGSGALGSDQRVRACQLLVTCLMVGAVVARPEQLPVRGQPELDERADRAKTVQPGQLLAFFPASGVVADGHLMDSVAQPQDAARDVRLDVEASPFQVQSFPEV